MDREYYQNIALKYKDQLDKVKVILFDADGILTDSKIYYISNDINFTRAFHTLDGYALKEIQKYGILTGIISSGNSPSLSMRAKDLKLDFFHFGKEDKTSAYDEVKKAAKVEDSEILYMGDDFNDLPLLKCAGLSVTVPHADPEIIEASHYITQRQGGEGCVREVINILRFARNFPFPYKGTKSE